MPCFLGFPPSVTTSVFNIKVAVDCINLTACLLNSLGMRKGVIPFPRIPTFYFIVGINLSVGPTYFEETHSSKMENGFSSSPPKNPIPVLWEIDIWIFCPYLIAFIFYQLMCKYYMNYDYPKLCSLIRNKLLPLYY